MSRNQFRNLAIEQLESREVMAGNVTAVLVGNTLSLTGDEAANDLEIHQIAVGKIRVESGADATTINGKAGPIDFDLADGNLRVKLAGGNDQFVVGDPLGMTTKLASLVIDTGAGSDG